MLNCEQNTRTMEKRVLKAWRQTKLRRGKVCADFEHGQWFVTHLDSGAQWSVCDQSGEPEFCFEQVSMGEEE